MKLLTTILATTLLSGCAGPRFQATNDTPKQPKDALANIDHLIGKTVVWGGVIADTQNLANSTRLEVVAYPLDYEQQPQSRKAATGRFLIEQPGYLEATDYAAQRKLTVEGIITGSQIGKVGEARYEYPVLKASKLHLWPQTPTSIEPSGIRFGIGINIGN